MVRIRRRRQSLSAGLKVRPASPRDLDILVHQRRAMWTDLGVRDASLHEKGDRAYRRWAMTKMKNHHFFGWIVENRGGNVAGGGCLWLQPIQPRPHRAAMLQPYLLSMYTEPEFRGHGVASAVVRRAIEWCRKNGYERLLLHASEMGRSVYRGLGFRRTWEMRVDIPKPSKRTPRPQRARRR